MKDEVKVSEKVADVVPTTGIPAQGDAFPAPPLERKLVIVTDGVKVRIHACEVSALEMLTLGNMLQEYAKTLLNAK